MSVFKSGKYWYYTFQVAERKHRGGDSPPRKGRGKPRQNIARSWESKPKWK